MGKVEKKRREKAMTKEVHEVALGESSTGRYKQCKVKKNPHQEETTLKGEKETARILDAAKKQMDEIIEELSGPDTDKFVQLKLNNNKDEDVSDEETGFDAANKIASFKMNAEDEETFKKFMNPNPKAKSEQNDMIKQAILESQSNIDDLEPERAPVFTQKMIEQYELLAVFMTKYRSGRVPTLLKKLPFMREYESALDILDPKFWSAAAMYQATKAFASGSSKRAVMFYANILLPRCRDDIPYYQKLNVHLYQALAKAMFKPDAFIKGIILPLCESGNCSLREAAIFSSLLERCSFPVDHACAAMYFIGSMDHYNVANSIFLQTFIKKKYTMPYQAIDCLVEHFLRFRNEKRVLSVIWHQCLLSFVQIYVKNISPDQRESLLELTKVKKHYKITPEIRKVIQKVDQEEIAIMETDSGSVKSEFKRTYQIE